MTVSMLTPVRCRPVMLAVRILGALAACVASAHVLAATLPTAPQTFDTTYAAPSGNTINVPAGGDFQAALNNAKLGDTIVLQAGATYTGPFTLPDKTSGSGWIYVVSSNYSSLPAPGKRVSPSNAANMPKILAPADSHALVTVADSNHFRFVGIEFAPEPGAYVFEVIQIGNGDTTPATLPNNIVFDRCYIHADPVQTDRRGVEMDGAYIAVIDSYISGFKDSGTDSQGLWAYNTTGPLKIVNNYIEAASENIMIGGAPSQASSLVPSDIDIEHNYFYKPLSLVGPNNYNVKNLLEFKAGRRVLVSGNTFENNPGAAQDGFALLITPRTNYGKAPWTTTTDISIVENTFINVGSGINIAGCDSTYTPCSSSNPPVLTERILVRNNLLEITGLNGADGRGIQFISGGSDFTIDHNTFINTAPVSTSPASDVAFVQSRSSPITNFVFTNNLATPTVYGFVGNGAGSPIDALNQDFSNWTFLKNVFTGKSSSVFPAGNFFPATVADVQFMDYAGGNYCLASTSPYKNAGTDGRDIGSDLCVAGSTIADPSAPTNLIVK